MTRAIVFLEKFIGDTRGDTFPCHPKGATIPLLDEVIEEGETMKGYMRMRMHGR